MSTTPRDLEANGLYNPFTDRKKWRVTCGECGHAWDERVPVQERCSAVCPSCRTQNVWSFTAFATAYARATT